MEILKWYSIVLMFLSIGMDLTKMINSNTKKERLVSFIAIIILAPVLIYLIKGAF